MNSSTFTVVKLRQGTQEWLDWRKEGIGASDASAVMGENPWKSPTYLLREKCAGKDFRYSNAKMIRGHELEAEARRRYEARIGIKVIPACLQSTTYHWLRASVDGLAIDDGVVLEIKCGESAYQYSSINHKVPDYYFGQLQHILAITSLQVIDFWCYLPSRPEVHIQVERDESYIKRLIETEHKFWNELENHRSRFSSKLGRQSDVDESKSSTINDIESRPSKVISQSSLGGKYEQGKKYTWDDGRWR